MGDDIKITEFVMMEGLQLQSPKFGSKDLQLACGIFTISDFDPRNFLILIKETEEYRWGLLKKIILDLYISKNCDPKLSEIFNKAVELINFKENREVLQRIILILGFKWYPGNNSDRMIMLETSKTRLRRAKYLNAMIKYREAQRSIIYLDEMFMSFPNFMNKTEGLNIIQAVGTHGFIQNGLLVSKLVLKYNGYFRDKTFDDYVEWLQKKLIPNLPPKSVVVIHKCPYFKKQVDKAPSCSASRIEMMLWLTRQGIPFTNTLYKYGLYELICKNKLPPEKKYLLNSIFTKYGHTVEHMPRFMPDWNPLAMVWKDLKFGLESIKRLTSVEELEDIVKQFFANITTEKLAFHMDLAKLYEKKYFDREKKLEDIQDALLDSTEGVLE